MVPGGHFVLEGPEARHAVAVKRLARGESVDIADGAGKRLTGLTPANTSPPTRHEVAAAAPLEAARPNAAILDRSPNKA